MLENFGYVFYIMGSVCLIITAVIMLIILTEAMIGTKDLSNLSYFENLNFIMMKRLNKRFMLTLCIGGLVFFIIGGILSGFVL
jgi:hypothetical protein